MSFLTVLNARSPSSRSGRLESCWELCDRCLSAVASRGGERKDWYILFFFWRHQPRQIRALLFELIYPLSPPLRPCFQIQSHWELGLSCTSTGGLGDMNTETMTMTESSCLQDTPYRRHKIRRKLGPVVFKHGSLGIRTFPSNIPVEKDVLPW